MERVAGPLLLVLVLLAALAAAAAETGSDADYVTRVEEESFRGKYYVYESLRPHHLTVRSAATAAEDQVYIYGSALATLRTKIYEVWVANPIIADIIQRPPVVVAEYINEHSAGALASYLTQPLTTIVSSAVTDRLNGNVGEAARLASALLAIFSNTSIYPIASEFMDIISAEQVNETALLKTAGKLYDKIDEFRRWLNNQISRYARAITYTTMIYFDGYGELSGSKVTINRLRETDYYRVIALLRVEYDENVTAGKISYSVMFNGHSGMDYVVSDNSEYAYLFAKLYSTSIAIRVDVKTDKVVSTGGGSFKVYVLKSSVNATQTKDGFLFVGGPILSFEIGFSKVSESGGAGGPVIPVGTLMFVAIILVPFIIIALLVIRRKRRKQTEEAEEEEEEIEEEIEEEEEEVEGYEE